MIRRSALTLGLLALLGSAAHAQSGYPNKPIRLLVPFAGIKAIDMALAMTGLV